ncbi:MAG: C4-dicarboxylate ABC transporter [Gammaproteobacteria bacterium]|nr:MAG: C4-dicarboxylate ABC transporter [Gammaproteobacteria bacterium]
MSEMSVKAKSPLVSLLTDRLPITVILLLLIFLIFARTGESLHGQLTKVGEQLWDDYYALREDVPTPTCNREPDIEARLNTMEAEAAASADDFDLFDEGFDRGSARISLARQKTECIASYAYAEKYQSMVTPGVKVFRYAEHQFASASLYATAQQQFFLVILLFVSAAVTTHRRHHIAFRPVDSTLDHRVSTSLQLIANAALAFSAWKFLEGTLGSSIEASNLEIINGLAIGSTVLALVSLLQLINMPKDAKQGGSLLHALLTVPLYTITMLIFAFITYGVKGHLPGLAIYFSAFFESAGTYLDVALYLWSGMLLKQTQLGERVFSLFTPWRLPPELLAFVAVVVMAVPTAFTGASSIIILAMGTVVYRELRKVGTRRQLALATTAMSGSSGIVLRPCLLVVIISILNKEVVTDDLFYWGVRVFMLTVMVFFFYALLTKQEPLRVAKVSEALSPSFDNFKSLIPYILVFAVMIALYAITLDAYMDQFSAPIMLPVLVIAVIFFERKISKAEPIYQDPERMDSVRGSLNKSMVDASIHIGALLMLMSTFMVITGMGGKMLSATFLTDFNSTYATMSALVVMFVFIGMFVESMAAVGMVSLMIAPIAYQQGINPIHFWMTCLVALELGYLSPPVALSHIFTRQVVGEKECILASQEGHNFYYRHEKYLLPLMVMGTTLLLVAFGPLIYGI